MLQRFIFLLIAANASVTASAQLQTMHIDLYDSKNGQAITGAHGWMSVFDNYCIEVQPAKVDGSGYQLPVSAKAIVGLAMVGVSGKHWNDRASCLQGVDQKPRFDASLIFKAGVVTENTCSHQPMNLQIQPGRIAFFVRPLTFSETFSRFLSEAKD